MESVISVLTNPPNTGNKNWRLTPDTIQEWMTIELDRLSELRENEHLKLKAQSKEPISQEVSKAIDFDKIFSGTWLESEMKRAQRDKDEYERVKKSYFKK